MSNKEVDKKQLMQGIKYLSATILLFAIGPVVINSSFKNQSHPMFYPILGLGIGICAYGIYLGFTGIKTIMKSIFGN